MVWFRGHRPLLHTVEVASWVSVYDPATHSEPFFSTALLRKGRRNHRKAGYLSPIPATSPPKPKELPYLPSAIIDPTIVLHPRMPRKLLTADRSPYLVVVLPSGNRISLW